MKKLIVAATLAALFSTGAAFAETKKVGVTPGPHAQLVEKVKEVAAKKGLELDIVEFSDYVVPNQALSDGDIDINSFQHLPYLENQVKERGLDLVSVAQSVNFPMAGYSKKIKALSELKDGASVSIPNDPSNGARALLLLADQKLITLKDGIGVKASVADITENPKNLNILELDAAQLPRSLDDVDLAAITTNYALAAGLNPKSDGIFQESTKALYVGIIAVRAKDKDADWVKTFVESYHSAEVKAFIEEKFKGAITPTW
jgi:D-methionine transport system substrate-binding protein